MTSFFAKASDPDTDDRLTYSISGPAFVSINSRTGEVTVLPGTAKPDTYSFVVTAKDLSGLKASRSFKVTVPQPNRAPLLSAPDKVTVYEGKGRTL